MTLDLKIRLKPDITQGLPDATVKSPNHLRMIGASKTSAIRSY
jgi:hypothetical protein